ncbi:MAG: TonB-dependent receptor, partial [Desulfocapsaceae bacterium]|nr:TonB-dependent receptor [Desulfocapsaceae bacterium]
TIRQSDEEKSLRVGIRHDFQPHSTLLATAILSTSDNSAGGIEEFGVSVDIANTTDSTMAEIQHVYTGRRVNLQSGSGYISSDETSSVSLGVPIGSLIEEDSTTEHATIYSYAQIDLSHQLTATLGLGGDLLDSPVKDREQVNPKLGISWQPVKSTLLRGAVFKTLQRRLVYAQTIEPTHVAGFNQFFDDFPATSAWTYAAGIDHSFKDNVFAGLQFFHRDLDVPFTWVADPTGVPVQVEDEWQEDVGSAYLYWAPATWFTAGLEYYYEQFTHDQWEGPQEIKSLKTHRLTPKIHFFHPSGISSRIQAHYVDQTGDFGSTFTGFSRDTEQFWIVDLEFTYRLPKRFGTLGLGVKNLFDEGFRFLDTDPANPRFLSEQQLFLSLTIAL